MSLLTRNFLGVVVAVFAFVPAASAQSTGTGCALAHVAGTFMQILRCQDGLTIVPETGAQFTLMDMTETEMQIRPRCDSKHC